VGVDVAVGVGDRVAVALGVCVAVAVAVNDCVGVVLAVDVLMEVFIDEGIKVNAAVEACDNRETGVDVLVGCFVGLVEVGTGLS
jgi:hypothetical protein